MSMLTVLFLVIVIVMPLTDPLTKLMPISVYTKAYYSSAQLQNEYSSEDGITNCARDNAETIGDENIVSPQVRQTSIKSEDGSQGEQGHQDQQDHCQNFDSQIQGDENAVTLLADQMFLRSPNGQVHRQTDRSLVTYSYL
jgi:hypothetical protein